MQQRENERHDREDKAKETENKPLSQTIANAHASGDGAMERGKDAIIDNRDLLDDETESNPDNNY